MSNKETGGLAFPFEQVTLRNGELITEWKNHPGMTLRQYAAIHLKVPDSGTDWLDDMINVSLLNDVASHALAGTVANPNAGGNTSKDFAHFANECGVATIKKNTEARK